MSVHFDRIAIIGMGLIGSSIARAVRENGLASHVVAIDAAAEVTARVRALGIADSATTQAAKGVKKADLVILCVPVGAYGKVARMIGPQLKAGAIISDVGSVKAAVVKAVQPHLSAEAAFVPAHPVAGTEHSGPDAGFATLFSGRWCILTPPPDAPAEAVAKVGAFWEAQARSFASPQAVW